MRKEAFYMKKNLKTRLINRKIKKPNPILMTICMWAMKILNKSYGVEFSYDYDPNSIKKQPTILLSSHASRLEFIYTVYGFKRRDINIVCGHQNILQRMRNYSEILSKRHLKCAEKLCRMQYAQNFLILKMRYLMP